MKKHIAIKNRCHLGVQVHKKGKIVSDSLYALSEYKDDFVELMDSPYQELFDFMADHHEVTLLKGDIEEIITIVNRQKTSGDNKDTSLIKKLENLIERTPSGNDRNLLCDINMKLHE